MAVEKLLTELTTLAASVASAASSAFDGLCGSELTALSSASTDDLIALVWLGKSLFAALTSEVASLLIVATCDFRPLTSPLVAALGRSLTELSRLLRSEQ